MTQQEKNSRISEGLRLAWAKKKGTTISMKTDTDRQQWEACEHGIPDGNYCESCNKAMKEARGDTPGKSKPQSMLYEICSICNGAGGFLPDGIGTTGSHHPCCKMLGVVETGATARQLESLAKIDQLRQEAGISAAMLRDGRARRMVTQFSENQTLTCDELTERLYFVKSQRDKLMWRMSRIADMAQDDLRRGGMVDGTNMHKIEADARAILDEIRGPLAELPGAMTPTPSSP